MLTLWTAKHVSQLCCICSSYSTAAQSIPSSFFGQDGSRCASIHCAICQHAKPEGTFTPYGRLRIVVSLWSAAIAQSGNTVDARSWIGSIKRTRMRFTALALIGQAWAKSRACSICRVIRGALRSKIYRINSLNEKKFSTVVAGSGVQL